jgi:hypothetical protein
VTAGPPSCLDLETNVENGIREDWNDLWFRREFSGRARLPLFLGAGWVDLGHPFQRGRGIGDGGYEKEHDAVCTPVKKPNIDLAAL